ncbi:MAG TPA: PAS domain S-box protein [Gemmataceae bacterium]|nr:PAS domain S-box protein [Gemmataceae bacterium]
MSESAVVAERATAIWEEQWHNNLRQTDRLFAGLLACEWLGGIIAALVIAPRTWTGSVSQVHLHVWAAVLLGGAITAFPAFLALARPSAALTRHSIAAGQMLFGALLIHLTGGRIESHFHVFGSLAFLAFYRDWRVLITASAIVAGDHLLRGFFLPQSVYGVASGAEWRWLEHAGWVVFEDIFLIVSCCRGIREMREIAERQALLETSNQRTEQTVRERTAELVERNHELQRATEKLQASEARTRSILDSAMDCIITMDHEGNVLEFNPAAERTFGYSRAQVVGRSLADLIIPPLAWDRARQDFSGYLASGEGWVLNHRQEMRARRADGIEFPAELAIVRVPIEGQLMFTGFVHDLTEEKQAENRLAQAREEKVLAEAANRAKNEFLSRMSHELRTPLNAILGFSQLLAMDAPTDDQQECIAQIARGGKHLLTLINEVLDIARIEAGRMDLSPEPVRVGDAFQEVLDLMQPLGASRGICLVADLEGTGGQHVLADYQKLKQVLLNLLSNAVKYNRENGEVHLSCEVARPGWLRLVVRDTGPGIPQEKLGRLFVAFDRLGAELTGVEGSGLGLALSKSLVELMGGTLTATSVLGAGSQFSIELVQTAGLPERVAATTEVRQAEAVASAGHTVLYIEDNLDNLRLVQRILAHRPGVHLLTAMQGSLGLELARQYRPDLILLDVHLPDLHGEQVLRRLQASAETRAIPVTVLSADATARQIEQLRAAGARDYLTKPIDVSHFLGMVDAVMEKGTSKL